MITADFRSDTVTRPTPAMLEAMFRAEVGDDVFGDDPTVLALQQKVADLFGMEAGLFCPSGTMANQIAIKILTQPQDEVVCDRRSHIYLYEGGGLAANAHISARLVEGDRGRIHPQQIIDNINPDDPHFARTTLVSLENTCNKGGGSIYTLEQIKAIHQTCVNHGLSLHLDGARVFNALIETQENPRAYGQYFHTISVCLSKRLGAPVDSVLLTSNTLIKQAKRIRKLMGGGMRQTGYLAAAGIYALDHHISRLKLDHERARILGNTLQKLSWIEEVFPTDTNIIIFAPNPKVVTASVLLERLKEEGIYAAGFGPTHIRMVTHLDITDDMLQYTIETLKGLPY